MSASTSNKRADLGDKKLCDFGDGEFDAIENKLIETLMPGIDTVIDDCITDIWKKYDINQDKFLSKEETKAFLKQTLKELGETADFSDEDFDAAFAEFDQDNNGSVDMDEMKAFIIKMANL